MATGLEALGAASAVLQVISFAADTISLCKKIYDGKPTAHDDLQDYAERMSSAVSRVQYRSQILAKNELSQYDEDLDRISHECQAAAVELKDEVRFVTSMQKKGSLFSAVNAMLRASSHRKKIERLENSLEKYRKVMETEMLSHICSQGDAIEIQQRQGFDNLEEDVQTLVKQISLGFTKLEDLVRTEHVVTREVIAKEALKTQKAIGEQLTTEVEALGINSDIGAQRQSFLQSLKFPEMNQRYNDLMSSKEASFRSVFASYREMTDKGDGSDTVQADQVKTGPTEGSEIDRVWSGFVEWLQSSDALFCIRGKPGSGKSTLVKFIIDNKNTKKLLSRSDLEVNILSHFFWKIGSGSQNSIKGLLCSLVYKRLSDDKELVEDVLGHFNHFSSNRHYHDWSTEDLKKVLYYTLEKNSKQVCIFVDGLDEICNTDGLFKLTQVIEEILKFPNIKICVSSRPETVVMNWINKKDAPGILLEDLTRGDMRNFVNKQFEPFLLSNALSPETHRKLAEELVWKAQGVFLWLHLATRSLINGIENGDSEGMLIDRLKESPSELKDMYADMWQRLNENNSIYRKTAARFFHYALTDQGFIPMFPENGFPSGFPEVWMPTLFQIACAESTKTQETLLTDTGTLSSADVERLCEETRVAIQTRSAGLLRLSSAGMGKRMIEVLCDANDLEPRKASEGIVDALFSRVVFIHRTAHDFFTDTETGQDILKQAAWSDTQVKMNMIKGLLCLLHFLHSEYGVMGRCKTIFYFAMNLAESSGHSNLQDAIDILNIVQKLYDNNVIGDDRPVWQPQAPFLSHITDNAELHDYVISTLARANSKTLATDVLREAWDPDLSLYYNKGSIPTARLIEALMEMGADPHVYGVNKAQRMGRMEPFARQGTAFSNLLMSGLNSIDDGAHLGSPSAREILKAAVVIAMTCPDLGASTLVIGRIKGNGQASLMNVTWLTRPETFVDAKSPWILYEVDFKFMLLQLLSGLAVDLDEDSVDASRVKELLPKLENPSSRIRGIITCDPESKAMVAHQILPQLSLTPEASEITERIFATPAEEDDDPHVTKKSKKLDPVYNMVMNLTTHPTTEIVDLESLVLDFIEERLGFCTLLEAGIIPPVSFIEHMEQYWSHYPLTTQKIKEAVYESVNKK